MKVYRTKSELSGHLSLLHSTHKRIGLVPTMGALHPGHASLVKIAMEENDVVVVSIFVNPTQFNDPSDLEHYPRTLEPDLVLLEELGVDLVFVPSAEEMYPDEVEHSFDLGGLDQVMEGKQRKGHFKGVARIVSKLFLICDPHRAYFGQKDFQQLVIVRRLVEIMHMDIRIVACPIIREADGLAMSSRNVKLNAGDRKLAPFIYATLKETAKKKGRYSPAKIKTWVIKRFEEQPDMKLEYFEIVEDKELRPVMDWQEKVNKVGCIAVQLSGVRLIDNLIFD
ncbi:MAG: pantoate--beta-alanine ligase [Bacteroidota bacterium]